MTRVLVGVPLLACLLAAIWFFTPIQLLVLVEVVVFLAFLEYAELVERLGIDMARGPAGVAALVACAAVGWPGWSTDIALMAGTLGIAALALTSGRIGVDALVPVFAGAFAPLYIGLPLGAIVAIRWLVGREAVLLLLLAVAASDTLQLYGGRLFGRHLLSPAISPKKTVEGAAAGFVGGMLVTAIAGRWWLPGTGTPWLLGLGAVIVALGMMGDLFESLLKRSAGVKDSAALLPGHGGVLDRIDAMLFAAPAYYVLVRFSIR
jgi:phosphatidate cytidylyltransferase